MPIAAVVGCGNKNVPTAAQIRTLQNGVENSPASPEKGTSSHVVHHNANINPRLRAQLGSGQEAYDALLGDNYVENHYRNNEDASAHSTMTAGDAANGSSTAEWRDSFKDYRSHRNNAMLEELKSVLQSDDMLVTAKAIIKRYIGPELASGAHLQLAKTERLAIAADETKYMDLKDKDGKEEDDHFFDTYRYYVTGTPGHKVLHVEGSSPVAIAHAWYEWVKSVGAGMIGWEANSLDLVKYKNGIETYAPTTNPVNVKLRRSPYEKHYFMNSAAAGYSTPWWTPEKWMDWLSWSALHGYDLMLDYAGHEAIGAMLYKGMGFSDQQIQDYYTGPAYATWGRLGNLAGFDVNPYFKTWCRDQLRLQHTVLNLMKKMSIKPIVASFAGFVPKDINSIPGYENATITKTHWTDYDEVPSYFLDPYSDDPTEMGSDTNLFKNLSKKYVQLYEKEFGPQEYYLADSFEEMTIPEGVEKVEFYEKVGEKLYSGIHEATMNHKKYSMNDANKNIGGRDLRGELALEADGATFKAQDNTKVLDANGSSWAFQGWMLGYQRGDWDYEALHSFLKFVPKNKTLCIDQAEDYNQTFWNNKPNFDHFRPTEEVWSSGPSFDGVRWVYSTIPNMGGNTTVTGKLDWYALSGLDALQTKNHGYLYAYGSAPEGIDNNPVTQELIADMGWRGQKFAFNMLDPSINAKYDDTDVTMPNQDGNYNVLGGRDGDPYREPGGPGADLDKVNKWFQEWLRQYSNNRYGFSWDKEDATGENLVKWSDLAEPSNKDENAKWLLQSYWKQRLNSANSYLDDHPIGYDQYGAFDTWTAPNSDAWLDALRTFGKVANARQHELGNIDMITKKSDLPSAADAKAAKQKMTPLFRDDLYRNLTIFLSILVSKEIVNRGTSGQASIASKAKIDEMYLLMDKIQAEHNTDRLERWLGYVRSWGHTAEEKAYYEQDAKRHLTIWYPTLNDYAAKLWSGLIKTYYKGRLDYEMNLEGQGHELGDVNQDFGEDYLAHELWKSDATGYYGTKLEDSRTKSQPFGDTQVAEAIKAFLTRSTLVIGTPASAKSTVGSSGYRTDMEGVVTKIQLSTQALKDMAGGGLAIYSTKDAMTSAEVQLFVKNIEIYFGNGSKAKFEATVTEQLHGGSIILVKFADDIWGTDANTYLRESNNGAEMRITWRSTGKVKYPAQFFLISKAQVADGSGMAGIQANLLGQIHPDVVNAHLEALENAKTAQDARNALVGLQDLQVRIKTQTIHNSAIVS